MFVATMVYCLAGMPIEPENCQYDFSPVWYETLEVCETVQVSAIANAGMNGRVVVMSECLPIAVFDSAV